MTPLSIGSEVDAESLKKPRRSRPWRNEHCINQAPTRPDRHGFDTPRSSEESCEAVNDLGRYLGCARNEAGTHSVTVHASSARYLHC